MTERSWVLTPHRGDHFTRTIHLHQKPGAKVEWKLTWLCCICCNPAKGRVDFEDSWLIKNPAPGVMSADKTFVAETFVNEISVDKLSDN